MGILMIHLRAKSHEGYSLIECLVYCGIVGFFIMAFLPIVICLVGSVSRLININHDLISSCVAMDLFYRDLKQRSDSISILSSTSNSLMWHCGDHGMCIGWSVHDGNLVRTEGQYVEATKSWADSKQSVVCDGIITGVFSVDRSTYPAKVLLSLTLRYDRIMERMVWV
jgi:hypothetical protein